MRLVLLLTVLAANALALELPAAKPSSGTIHRWVSLPASLAPWQQAVLHAKVTGYVDSITVDKGDAVKAGQVLATLEVPEVQADIAKARAEVAAAEIEVKRLHAARAKSPDLILPQSVDDAESKLSIAKANLERNSTMLQFASITAPFAGLVTARHIDTGALVTANTTKVVEVMDVGTVRLQIPVTEMESAFVVPDRPVKVQIDALGPNFSAPELKISRIAYALDRLTRTMLAEADIKNPDLKLRPGMYVMAKISVETHTNATLIPVTGLVMEKTAAFVFKHVNGKAVKTPVKPIFNDGTQVEIPELKPEDVILLPGTTALVDGQAVTVKQ